MEGDTCRGEGTFLLYNLRDEILAVPPKDLWDFRPMALTWLVPKGTGSLYDGGVGGVPQ